MAARCLPFVSAGVGVGRYRGSLASPGYVDRTGPLVLADASRFGRGQASIVESARLFSPAVLEYARIANSRGAGDRAVSPSPFARP